MIIRFWKWTCGNMTMLEYMTFWIAVLISFGVTVLWLGGVV